jgi:hypothetical protein
LLAAERVAGILEQMGVEAVVIGALALAAHGYPRSTDDLDLAIGVDPKELAEIARELQAAGFSADVNPPDEADPLGGVVRVRAEGVDLIELVNFKNPPGGGFPALIEMATREAVAVALRPRMATDPGKPSALRVVTLPHLVLFKLYAGGPKSKTDVLELLSRNPGADLETIRELARRFRMGRRLDAWLRDLGGSADD